MISIYIVDDEPMAIQYLEYLLEKTKLQYKIAGTSTNSTRGLQEILRLSPDVIFTDISMPVMDGLTLTERILEKRDARVYLLTSYEDFEYAKRSVKIGAAEYLLKNELTEEMLRELLLAAEEEIGEQRRRQHVILERNLRNFLLSGKQDAAELLEEDHIYEQRPNQRYALLCFYMPVRFRMQERSIEQDALLDCYQIQNIAYPEGLRCSGFTQTGRGEYSAVIFINSQVQDCRRMVYKVSDRMLAEIDGAGSGWRCIQSDIATHFLQLPGLYQTALTLKEYLYAYPQQSIFCFDDVAYPKDQWPEEESQDTFYRMLEEEKHREAVQLTKDFFVGARGSYPQWKYEESMRTWYRILRRSSLHKGLSDANLSLSDEYINTENLERSLLNCVEMYFEELERRGRENHSAYIYQALELIHRGYARDLSVAEIAEKIGISEGHLRRLFKQEMDTSVIDYLTDYRLEQVKKLMREPKMSITEIWQQTGFSSAQYFSYVFKKKEGLLPRDYLKKLRGGD